MQTALLGILLAGSAHATAPADPHAPTAAETVERNNAIGQPRRVAQAPHGAAPHGVQDQATVGGEGGLAGEEGDPTDHGAAGGHGTSGEHGDGAAAGSHGSANAEHHPTFGDDDDHDGTANWLDSDSHSYVLVKLGSQAVAFFIVMGILLAFARKPIADFMAERSRGIRRTLVDSAAAKAEAERHAADIQARLTALETELGQLRTDAEAEARAEEAKLVERAHEESRRVSQVAERKIRDEVLRAQIALRQEAVDLAVKLAENTLRTSVNTADQQRLARDFLESLKRDGANAHG